MVIFERQNSGLFLLSAKSGDLQMGSKNGGYPPKL